VIQLHRLEGFYWVARCGGYAKAAREFPYPITQPAVHQQVKKLEGELEVVLFERIARDRVQVTPAGQRLLEFCAPFFEGLPAVVRAIRAQQYGGELRIASGGLVVRGLLPDWVRRLTTQRPDIQVHLEETGAPDFEQLRTGQADLIVDFLPELPAFVGHRQVGSAYSFLALPSIHRLAHRKRLAVRDMADEPFISYPPGTTHHNLQMAALHQFSIAPRAMMSASSVDSILAFVRAGLGYSIVPWLDRKGPALPGLVAIRQGGAEGTFPITAAWRRGPTDNPLVEAALRLAPGK
jgi:DNA-binding transcriptional LysR family regulator